MPVSKKPFLIFVLIFFVTVLVFAGLIMNRNLVRWMVYPAPHVNVPSPPSGIEEIVLNLNSSTRVIAWTNSGKTDRPVLLFFHGNGENLGTMAFSGFFQQAAGLGVNFVCPDYPGYGRSTGKPSESLNAETAAAAVEWIQINYNKPTIIAAGWSLGAAVTFQTAAKHPNEVSGLIAISAWSSLPEVAVVHFPGFFVKFLLNEKYDSASVAPGLNMPVLLIHGGSDQIIPVEHGRILKDKLGSRVRWIEIPEAGHNDVLSYPEVWEEMARFVSAFDSQPQDPSA
jgi:pimeloyl-ACP methyl ester carboxylesterase